MKHVTFKRRSKSCLGSQSKGRTPIRVFLACNLKLPNPPKRPCTILYTISRLRLAVARRSVSLSAGLQVEDPFALELQKAGSTGSTAAAVTDLELPSTCKSPNSYACAHV
jgi:hypothetical protein